MLMVDYGRKWCRFTFKSICGPKPNKWGKCEEWEEELRRMVKSVSLFTLLNADSSRQFYSEMLLKLAENTF